MEETQKEIYEHEKEEYERKMKERKEHPDVKVICATEREPHGKTVKQIFEKLPENSYIDIVPYKFTIFKTLFIFLYFFIWSRKFLVHSTK